MQIHDRGNIASRYIPSGSRELADTSPMPSCISASATAFPMAIAYCGKRGQA